ncbi:uncharacterized protein LOC118286574 [Scophthalmus maximus]|uniref:uncharacterized protein LOC118286574 n=1 Tax=Scophthalmus maximus TaxID=52904 RepID=UPI001FA86BBA|nr:uncharacterized protein LOC118286574 [Scophthalmus maximus]
MGGPRTSIQVLLLSAVRVVALSVLISAIPTASEICSSTSDNSNPNSTNGYQDPCHVANLQNASHGISAAVDTLLSCKRGKNGSLSADESMELEQNLRKIQELTLKVFFDLRNTTLGPGSLTSENSNPNSSSGYQGTCQAVNLRNASHRISAAVVTLAEELSCKSGKNGSFSEDQSMELEQNLRKIMELTLKVFFDLVCFFVYGIQCIFITD